MTTSSAKMSAATANRHFYSDYAATYDHVESCLSEPSARELLDRVLAEAARASRSSNPLTLDACGGTGNVSAVLSRQGITTTLVDVSPAMLKQWEAKARELGVRAEVVEGEIGDFLASDERRWDLIVFSSALHHLDDYSDVFASACSRLAPGGVLVSVFDPTFANDMTTRALRRLDHVLKVMISDPSEFTRGIRRKLNRASRKDQINVGAIAEKHAIDGVDDRLLVAAAAANGLEIIEYERYPLTRLRFIHLLFRMASRPTTFHLIVRKPRDLASNRASEVRNG